MFIFRVVNLLKNQGITKLVKRVGYKIIYSFNNRLLLKDIRESELDENWKETRPLKSELIVSLTSYPARFPVIGICLKSLLLQSIRPYKIIVYLGSDSTEEDLTDEMKEYQKYGVEYRIDSSNNLKPHKKYFYAMIDYPDKVIVTADDDIVYPKNWLESLYESYKQYPMAVSAWRVHKIEFSSDGEILPYSKWTHQYRGEKTPSHCLFATGCGGCLYPPGLFDKEVINIDNIKKYSLEVDDIWLKCMEIRNNIPVVWVYNWHVDPACTDNYSGLFLNNVFKNKNDEYFTLLRKLYNLDDSMFM